MINLKIKKLHDNFVLPSKAKEGDACYDLTAVKREIGSTKGGNPIVIFTFGFSAEIPPHWCALLFPRSSQSSVDQTLGNCVGVIDSSYRGEWQARFKYDTHESLTHLHENEHYYQEGDRVAQFMLVPVHELNFELVNELTESPRGDGGFGHTGS